jgi:Domain of unknown function (DUF1990)
VAPLPALAERTRVPRWVEERHVPTAKQVAAPCDGGPMADRQRADLLALHVADNPHAPRRDRGLSRRGCAARAPPQHRPLRAADPGDWRGSFVSPPISHSYSRDGALTRGVGQRIAADPNRISPSEFATFQKVRGEKGRMRLDDEFLVRTPGPWDGPVRVVDVTPTSFRLATLEGHLEAGQIEFRAVIDEGLLTFAIESWARSADRLTDLLYDRLRMSKQVQLHMWTSALERVAKLAGGRMTGGVDIHTRRDAPRQLFGLDVRVTKAAGTAVVDSAAYGKLYVSPVSLSRFEENAGQTNTSTVRLEGHGAFGTERTAAAARIMP